MAKDSEGTEIAVSEDSKGRIQMTDTDDSTHCLPPVSEQLCPYPLVRAQHNARIAMRYITWEHSTRHTRLSIGRCAVPATGNNLCRLSNRHGQAACLVRLPVMCSKNGQVLVVDYPVLVDIPSRIWRSW